MSCIIEEPGEIPINVYNGYEIEAYWLLHSKQQKKRFKSVMRQLREIWWSVHSSVMFYFENGLTDDYIFENSVKNIYRLFFMEHRCKIDFNNEEKIYQRRKKDYIKNKINKMKNKKYNM
jgi:hypothetical protein